MYKIKRFLSRKTRIQFYFFIYPYQTHLRNLVVQQKKKRVIRLIADSPYLAHTTPLFSNLKLLKFKDIFRYNASIYMFQNHLNDQFSVQHEIPTRSRSLAVRSFNRLTLSQHSISFTGPNTWNNLPTSIRGLPSISVFKSRLENYLLLQYG